MNVYLPDPTLSPDWKAWARGLIMELNKFFQSSSAVNAMLVPSVTSGATPNIRAGTGTPEGIIVAPVGSLFMRSDGGAGTSLYVKESGVGNTGWIAK